MTLIPAGHLSRSDLAYLGPTVASAVRRDRVHRLSKPARQPSVRQAVQRSLAAIGEGLDLDPAVIRPVVA